MCILITHVLDDNYMHLQMLYLPAANEVWGKVIFSQVSVSLFTGGGHACWEEVRMPRRVCMPGGHACQGGMCGGGHVCLVGGCVAGGMHGGGHAWQERWSLQRAVRILLECILVFRLCGSKILLEVIQKVITYHCLVIRYLDCPYKEGRKGNEKNS